MAGRSQQRGEDAELQRKLDGFYDVINGIVLKRQHPVTGLLPASVKVTNHGDYRDAWVRDNVYSILCVWALSLAYEKLDYDQGRTYELKHSVVKLMRGLLFSMMRQAEKVEKFKNSQAPLDSLHAKYNTSTCDTVVGDADWGHLQLDATSLFLLMLAEMTASGLQIIFTLDEVNFIQNLVFYIERAYRTPDFGVWERGNKANNGQAELNSSSIGMVTAALEALDGLDLFGSRGGPDSIIHVIPDEISRNYTILQSFLPRESNSKEVDASVLAVIGFPAFAVGNPEVIQRTKKEILLKLEGPYGFKRFLLDGHQSVVEDPNRLHYEPHELKVFSGIECEWPLFFAYMVLDNLFHNNIEEAKQYREKLEQTLVTTSLPNGITAKLVPELYLVPKEAIDEVRQNPSARVRVPNENVPLVWAQSLMLVGDLVLNDLITIGELDPIGRRFRPLRERKDTLVQIVLISEDEAVQAKLSYYGVETETVDQIAPVKIHSSKNLGNLYTELGKNEKLGLSGRPNQSIGSLGTCKAYRVGREIHVFTPSFMELQQFYLASDNDIIVGLFKDELQFVRNNWNLPGRPTMFILFTKDMMSHSNRKNLINLMSSLKTGSCNHVRVRLGRMREMMNSSSIHNLDFLSNSIDVHALLRSSLSSSFTSPFLKLEGDQFSPKKTPLGRLKRKVSLLKTTPISKEVLEDIPLSASEEQAATIEKATLEEAIQKLKETHNIFVQADILEHLVSLKGLDFRIEGLATIRELVEETYDKSLKSQIWSVVRQMGGLMKYTIDSLSAAVVEILIRQKLVILGEGKEEYVIKAPERSRVLFDLIFSKYSIDIREACLVQEILFFLGSFIKAEPQMFIGILILRISYLIEALKLELAIDEKLSEEEADEKIFQLGPSNVRNLLKRILTIHHEEDHKIKNNGKSDIQTEDQFTPPPTFDHLLYDGVINEDGSMKVKYLSPATLKTKRSLEIIAQSAGYLDGDMARLLIDGKVVFEMSHRGMGVVTVNLEEGNIEETAIFDTYASVDEAQRFVEFISSFANDVAIILLVKDEASEYLTENARVVCEQLGSLKIRELGFRGSWALISVAGEAVEELKPARGGTCEVSKTLEIWESSAPNFLFPSNGKVKKRRHITGGLNRVPSAFYSAVYNVLAKVDQGLLIGDQQLDRNPTIADMTSGEINFEMKVLSWFNKAHNTVHHSSFLDNLFTDLIFILDKIAEKNPEVKFGETIRLDAIINEAIKICWNTATQNQNADFAKYHSLAREYFYDLPTSGKPGSLPFIIQAIEKLVPLGFTLPSDCVVS